MASQSNGVKFIGVSVDLDTEKSQRLIDCIGGNIRRAHGRTIPVQDVGLPTNSTEDLRLEVGNQPLAGKLAAKQIELMRGGRRVVPIVREG